MMELLASLSGRLVCAFGRGLARWTGNAQDAEALCMFIVVNDL